MKDEYKYYYKPTEEYKKRCHPDLCGYIATNHTLSSSDKLQSGYEISLCRSKRFPSCRIFVREENYEIIGFEEFKECLLKIGVILFPKIGQIVNDISFNNIERRGQIMNIFEDEVQIENYLGDIKRIKMGNIGICEGIDLAMYQGKGRLVFKIDFTGQDEKSLKSGDVLGSHNCINELNEIKDVTIERKINALKKEINQLENFKNKF